MASIVVDHYMTTTVDILSTMDRCADVSYSMVIRVAAENDDTVDCV